MPIQDNYTQRLGLAELDVFLDTPDNSNRYFNIINLPQIAGYGKYSFQISYNDPDDTDLLLKQGSGILFEFVDANGETIFSELSDIPDASGAASGYFWIKKDPLWLAGEIADGPATLYIVGELDNVPEEFEGTYNVRTAFTFDIRKSQPNISRILFHDVPALEQSSSINGQIQEFDRGSSTFARGYIEVSASHMETHGGQVNFIELSYLESGSRTEEFTPLAEYPLRGSSSRYELDDTGSIDGLNPISHVFRMPVPRDFRRDSEVKFKLKFLDANKSPAKYYDEIKNDQVIEITSSFITVSGTPFIIENEDNLLKGSMFTGQAVGKGFETSGKSSAFMKTVDYTGFKSASLGIGSPGVMFFSGSVLTSSGDNYQGVGLELFANTESFLRFRSDPSELDIKTKAFFVGSETTQFISASGGTIEISSSNFHLEPSGDVTMTGTIEAADGKIGGFHISESRINSENEKIIFKSSGQISASSLLLASGSFIVDPDNLSRFGQDGFQSFVMAENTGVIIQTSNFNLNTARFIISSSDVGVMAVGSTPPVAHNSGTGFYVDGDGNFLVGKSTGPRLQFDGFQTTISSSNFFLGSDAQFVSGSNGNIEISSSNFHLDAAGNVIMAGTITANAGTIGGFNITNNALSSDNFFISGAATGAELFISSSGFSVDAQGVVSASDLSLQGGDVGGLSVAEGTVSVGEILKLKDSGQITGSQVLFTGGKISGSALDIIVPKFFLGSEEQFVSGSNGNIEISSSDFHLDKDGSVNMSGTITATAGAIGGFGISSNAISSSNNNLILKDSGQITGSTALFTGGKIAGWTISGTTLVGNNATLDGAGSALFKSDAGPDTDNSAPFDEARNEFYIDFSPSDQSNTRNFFVKFGPNFMVDSDGILIASGATFAGTITASAGLIGGFVTDSSSFHDNSNNIFISGSPKIGGNHHPSFMFISSSNFNVKQSGDITGSSALFDGIINVTGTGQIAGFGITQTAISSSNDKLILKSSGQITGSDVLFSGGKIGGFTLGTNTFTATNFELDPSGKRITLGSGNSIFIADGDEGIQLGHATFADAPFSVTTAGVLKATSGTIGGFTLSTNELTATNFELNPSQKRITLGSSNDIFIADGDEGIQLGHATFNSAPFSVTKAGFLHAAAGRIGGFGISSNSITSSNDNLILKDSGQITGSTVLFTGGKIGGFTIDADEIKSTNLLLDSNNEKITVGSANAITIQGGGTDNFIVMGSKTAFAQTSTAGVILGMDNNVPSFDLTRNSTNYVRFDTSTGVDIKTDTFKLDTATLDIDSSTSRIQVVDGSSNEVVRLGEISDSASDLFGLKVYDGSGTADANTLVKLGGEGNTIGGWTITNDQIRSLNLVIHSSGRLETADFASGVKGWRISSEGNGEAEFENATIRGTLSTAVFEKETVNAVGGQLYVANSTALTGSGQISASFDTMSVVNVSGFAQGEILSLKKVSDTGFTTEYVLVNSSSRDDKSSDTNFSGKLNVTRGYGSGVTGDSGSLGGSPNNAQSYEPGQVIVSTGKVGTGYIRLNANPNDQATPFMDIVERTGSGIYDIELKTRVGDLSGLSSGLLFGESNPGFGIFTGNGFFSGGITATTGSFTGAVHINTSASEIMKLGTNVSGTDDGIFVNNNNFLFTDGRFKTGNATNFISHDGAGAVEISSQNFTLKGGTKLLMTSESLAFDTSNASTATRTAGTGVFMDVDGNFRVGNASGNRLTFAGSSLELVTTDLNIDTSTFDVSTDNGGKIAMGATPPTSITSGTGIFMSGSGEFLAGNASGNHIKFDGTNVQVAGQITISAGSTSEVDFGAGAAASASAASASAATAQSSASAAQTLASEASASAAVASSSAATATAAASTAQSAIDTMETQVVLTNEGMSLRAVNDAGNPNLNGQDVVQVGTTTKFFDGVDDTDANQKLRLNTDGVFAFANTTQSFARFFSEGVQIVSGGVERAKFAGTTTIGNTAFEHVEITSASLKLKGGENGSITRLSMDADGMQIGSVSNGITLNASGDATFNGAITIAPSDLPQGTVSGSAQLADAISGSANQISASAAAQATQVVLDSNGMSLKSQDTSKTLASFGTTVTIGENADDKSRVFIDNDSVDLIVDSGGTDTTFASFGATTTVGNASAEHVSIDSDSVDIIQDANNKAVVNASGLTITQGGNNVATFGSTARMGQTSAEHILVDSTGLLLKDNTDVIGKFVQGGATLGKTGGAHISASTTDVSIIRNNNNKAIVDADGLTITQSGAGVAKFASTTTIGETSTEHVEITSTSFKLKDGSTDRLIMNSDGISIGNQFSVDSDGDATFGGTLTIGNIVSSSAQLADAISGSSNAFSASAAASIAQTAVDSASVASAVQITSDGLNILRADNGSELASYGATTTIGSTSAEHISISSDAIEIKTNANTTVLSASSAGLDMAGTIKASGGTIGGFNIGTDLDSSAGTLKLKGATGQITASDAQITGKIIATTGTIGGFNIGSDLGSSGGTLNLKGSSGQITGSNVLFSGGDIGGFILSDDKFIGQISNAKTFTIDSGQSADLQYDGNDASGIIYGPKSSHDLGTGVNFTGSAWVMSDAGGANEGIFFRAGVKDTFVKLSTTGGEDNGVLAISSSNFSIDNSGNVTMAGTVTADGGSIGGFTINGSQLTGSSGAILATAASGDRAVLDGTNNDLRFYESGKGGTSTSLKLGKFGQLTFGTAGSVVNQYGIILSGSSFNVSKFSVTNPDVTENLDFTGVPNTFQTNISNISSTLDMGSARDVFRGRAGAVFTAKTGLASDLTTTGLLAGMMGQIEDDNLRWDMSAGGFFVSSEDRALIDADEGGGVGDGSWALATVGRVMMTGSNGSGFSAASMPPTLTVGDPGGKSIQADGLVVMKADATVDGALSVGGTISGSLIRSSGDVVAFHSSDKRLKDNIRTIEEPIYKLRQLKGVEYEWNNKQDTYPSGSLDSGIIAQDVQKVLPQLVKEKEDGYLGVRHDRLVGLLVEAIKDQQDQIDEMKEQIKELKDGSS